MNAESRCNDELYAKQLQEAEDRKIIEMESKMMENERAALEIQEQEDLEYAKYHEAKQKDDEQRSRVDGKFAIQLTKEVNRDIFWFCDQCMTMNHAANCKQCTGLS